MLWIEGRGKVLLMCIVSEERPSLVRARFCGCVVSVKRGQVWSKYQTLLMNGGREG